MAEESNYYYLGFRSRHPQIIDLLDEYFDEHSNDQSYLNILPQSLRELIEDEEDRHELNKICDESFKEGKTLLEKIREQIKDELSRCNVKVNRYKQLNSWRFELFCIEPGKKHKSKKYLWLLTCGAYIDRPISTEKAGYELVSWLWIRESRARKLIIDLLKKMGSSVAKHQTPGVSPELFS